MARVKTGKVAGWWVVSLLAAVSLGAASEDPRVAEAVKRQDQEAAQALVKQKVDVNAPLADGSTALHWAAHWDALDTVDALLGAGARVNVANELGVSPLSLACSNGSAAMVEKLLQGGADPNAFSADEPALMTCALTGSVAAVRALLDGGADVNRQESLRQQTALMWAVAERHVDIVGALIERGADVNAHSGVTRAVVNQGNHWNPVGCCCCPIADEAQRGGSTPLLFAARNGHMESAEILLDAGANIHDTMADGNSALVLATHSGHGKLAAFLLDKGADPNAAGAGYTALHAAVLRGDLDLVKTLLARGANPGSPMARGTPVNRFGADYTLQAGLIGATPFLLAAKFAELEMMRVFKAAGADPSVPMADGHTPLMAAVGISTMGGTRNRREIDLGPRQVRVVDEEERLAVEVVNLGIDLGADLNAVNEDGNTALHLAVFNKLNSVVQLLADRGANLNVRNKRGLTPLAVTSGEWPHLGPPSRNDRSSSSTAELLRKLGATS